MVDAGLGRCVYCRCMRWLLFLLALGFLVVGCDSVSPTAPSGALLVISANPDRIGAIGESVITVFRDGPCVAWHRKPPS